jgi:hypothetical protein
MIKTILGISLGLLLLSPLSLWAWPVDGYPQTGIRRLEEQRLIAAGEIKGTRQPAGGLWPTAAVDIRLLAQPDLSLPAVDAELTAEIVKLLGDQAENYGVAVLDLTDPNAPVYAEYRGGYRQNVGSVGKLLAALGFFQALADAYPADMKKREELMRNTIVTADRFSHSDHHSIRLFDVANRTLVRRPMEDGDQGNLWEYLDWTLSVSSNAAAAMTMRDTMLLRQFGTRYPIPDEQITPFFDDAPAAEKTALFQASFWEPVSRNGLSLDEIRQGSFFTRQGKNQIPGTNSYATPRALTNFMLKLEQGKLVDEWSSREIKRLMYITERRIRYGSSGVLRPSAVYFKSGSLYSCAPEEGFVCKKYHGNKRNYMNSVAIIETPAAQNRLFYAVAVLSNVLKKNSAQDHRDLARAVHSMLLGDHPPKPIPPGGRAPETTYGIGFIGYEEERREMELKLETQEALLALGYEIGEIDGVIGKGTRGAIRTFQKAQGDPADGKPSAALIAKMRTVAQSRGLSRPNPAP